MKRMNPNNCSVVVFHNHTEELESTLSLLHAVFSDVIVKSTQGEIISELKEQQANETTSTLLLIDAESCHMNSISKCPDLLLTVVGLLKEGIISNVVPTVCSTLDSPVFMVKCLQAGAADFILKPLSEDVTKTLFLNVTRYYLNKNDQRDSTDQLNLISNKRVCNSKNNSANLILEDNKGQVWSRFKGRLKGVFLQETWLFKLVADYYTPKPSVRRSSMTSMLNDRKEYLKTQICSWDFLPLDLDNKDLIQVVYMILDQILTTHQELEPLRVPSGDLYHFIFDICNSYHSANPYHNFRHAVDVLQASYYFLCKIGAIEPMCQDAIPKNADEKVLYPRIKDLFMPLDIFALLMASLGHDVGHPGVNNAFMVNTSTPLALLYNDRSVLESFHAMSFFHLLQEHCFGQLTDIRSNPEYASFRKVVVNSILATDMGMHDEYVSKIKEQAERLRSNGIDFSDKAACEREKILLCGALIKCADISNCARPFESAKRWAKILAEEFFEQGDLERELNLTVLPMNDRGKIPLEEFQLTFKRFIALKLFDSVSQVTSQMHFTVDYINENIGIWEKMKQEEKPPVVLDKKEEAMLVAEEKEQQNVVMPNNSIPPQQPSPEGKTTTSQRPRSGI